ncbi:NAD(P)-binding protein [Setomelanomma holmii]|uniref:NAD(P)-binding protein n=1 Tax=Setomelanomma holmii TaxID=210430 RepID=A0A9P4LK42_9PLEO|nr:NAD(P)-binding protein [Setomelanomma holmii]
MHKISRNVSQAFPPKPTFTESSLSDLKGKVYIVTGASAGVGKELSGLLYSRNATVYLATRNANKTAAANDWIKQSHPTSSGALHFLKLDLNDLEGIKPAAEEFLSKEKRLDVLFNNAGVMVPPKGSVTKQGYEQQLGTDCLAPFLFTKLLTPLLLQTAKSSPAGSVRVVWVSSSAAELIAPTGGVDMTNLNYANDKQDWHKYGVSKGGNVLHALEYQRRHQSQGITSVALNPGNLKSDLQRHVTWFQNFVIGFMLYPPVMGAYTQLFAGLAPEVKNIEEGSWVIPWGRIGSVSKNYVGGSTAGEFWKWSEGEVARFV